MGDQIVEGVVEHYRGSAVLFHYKTDADGFIPRRAVFPDRVHRQRETPYKVVTQPVVPQSFQEAPRIAVEFIVEDNDVGQGEVRGGLPSVRRAARRFDAETHSLESGPQRVACFLFHMHELEAWRLLLVLVTR